MALPIALTFIAAFSSFVTKESFYYTSENVIVRGPLISIPFIASAFYFVYMLIDAAKKQGLDVTLETCAHYLLFNENAYETHGVYAKCAPPLRAPSIQQEMIDLVVDGKIDFITSDHSPCPPELKDLTKMNFFEAWGGISGGQFTLLTMLDIAKDYQLPLTTIAKLLSASPAERFGLAKKGQIAVNMDADFVIIEEGPYTVTREDIYARHKETLYEGHQFSHRIVATYSKGVKVFEQRVFESDLN